MPLAFHVTRLPHSNVKYSKVDLLSSKAHAQSALGLLFHYVP